MPDCFAAQPHRNTGLMAHLDDNAVFFSRPAEVIKFPKRAHKRLLNENMNPLAHRLDGDGGVDVVGGRNRHRLDAEQSGVVQKLAVVRIERHAVHIEIDAVADKTHLGVMALGVIAVAERDDFDLAGLKHRRPVGIALAHHADDGKLDLLFSARAHAAADRKSRSSGETADEISS